MPHPPSSSSRTAHRRSLAMMLFSALCFTTNILLIRGLSQFTSVDIWSISSARFLLGLIIVSTLYHREFQPKHLLIHPRLIIRGVVGGLGISFYYLTVAHLGAGRASFINNTYVLWGSLLAVWILGERLKPSLAIGTVTTIAGLALLTNVFATGSTPGIYDFVAIMTAGTSAWTLVLIRQLHATEHTSTIFASQCLYGMCICAIPTFLHFNPISATTLILLIATSASGVWGQICMTRALRDLHVAEGALLQMLIPPGVALGGFLFFDETYRPLELIGATLIVAGMALPAIRR